MDSAQAKTSQSTGIQVQKPASDLTKPYAFYTTAYVTDDGTIHVAYGVDLSHTVSDRWWSESYAPPDRSGLLVGGLLPGGLQGYAMYLPIVRR